MTLLWIRILMPSHGPELLLLGVLDQVRAHLLQGLDVPPGEGDADTVNWGFIAAGVFGVLVSRHFVDIGSFLNSSDRDEWIFSDPALSQKDRPELGTHHYFGNIFSLSFHTLKHIYI